MHSWGDKGVDWDAINDAAIFIGVNLRRWGLVTVFDVKEKWGTVRVYCSFGLLGLAGRMFNWFLVPYQKWMYRQLYRAAIKKWPHIRREILEGADWSELLAPLGVHSIRKGPNSYEIVIDWSPGEAEERKRNDLLLK